MARSVSFNRKFYFGGEMSRTITTAMALMTALMCTKAATAGVYADDLSKCLVKSTNDDDRIVLMKWSFSSLTTHPALKELSNITPEQRVAFNKAAAVLFERLVFNDCRKETVEAVKNEGTQTFEASFRVLGEVAARGMYSNANVMNEIKSLVAYLDKGKFASLAEEAEISQKK